MNSIHHEISTPSQIKKLGFGYSDETGGSIHFINNIQVPMDMTLFPQISLEDIERNLELIFYKVLQQELFRTGVKKLRKVEWERWYMMDNWWTARQFTAIFNLRISGLHAETPEDTHLIRF